MSMLGFDIGGANIKIATADGRTRSVAFPLWKQPDRLVPQLTGLVAELADCERVAVTMTGELADCFATRREGVRRIADAVMQSVGNRPTRFWTTAGRFVTRQEVEFHAIAVAAGNWHALATWIGRQTPTESALLIDIGSTTTDIVPIWNGEPAGIGLTDRDRLAARELVYSGVRRTPLCAVVDAVPWGNDSIPIAAELFATTLDAYLLLRDLPEDPADQDTANGGPATVAAAQDRIARMVCSDREDVSREDAVRLARHFAAMQQRQIVVAVRTVLGRLAELPGMVVLSGSGEFLSRRVIEAVPELAAARIVSLADAMDPGIAEAACAYAVTQLAVRDS
jgi:(4-(4-[2-(gamma-L-glutamylamino)ethyl]phenoxymethyl)furan-2-yl)methanamine synthase